MLLSVVLVAAVGGKCADKELYTSGKPARARSRAIKSSFAVKEFALLLLLERRSGACCTNDSMSGALNVRLVRRWSGGGGGELDILVKMDLKSLKRGKANEIFNSLSVTRLLLVFACSITEPFAF